MAIRLPQKIAELTGDVNITSPVDGQVLKYDAASGKWIDDTDAVNEDMTPEEILAALLTVDGESSGLDADKLDGQKGSYYATQAEVDANVSAIATLETDYVPYTGATSDIDLGSNNINAALLTTSYHINSGFIADGQEAIVGPELIITGELLISGTGRLIQIQ